MTVHPVVIHLGRLAITGYGIMMMCAFLLAGWVFARRLAEAGLDGAIAWDSVVFAVIGGLAGAKLYYAALVHEWAALVSRGGLVWYGGFAGGVAAVAGYLWWKKLSILRIGDLIAPALALGYAIGRVGCFLVGDDYGVPTSLPWGVAFPQGSPPTTARVLRDTFHVGLPPGTSPDQVLAVHPTQLYEVALALGIFALLWRVRATAKSPGWLLGLYLVLSGCERLFVEIFRAKDDRFFGPFTLAQVLSVVVVLCGARLIARARAVTAAQPEPASS